MTACTDYKPVGDTTSDLSLEVIHRNGIVANIWMHEESRFDVLRKNNMRYLFIDVGNTGEDGKLTTPRSEIREFLTRLNKYEKENGYAFTLFAYSEINTDNYNVDNNFLDNFIQDYKQLITDGFDGVLVDIEPVKIEERENYIKFLKNLRKNISENSLIAVYSGAFNENVSEWEWNYPFFRKVSDNSDIIVIPVYDTWIDDEEKYVAYVKSQVGEIAKRDWHSWFMLGIPTHKKYPETIENALNTWGNEVIKYPKSRFLGVSIFSEWTMDSSEWEIFEDYDASRYAKEDKKG